MNCPFCHMKKLTTWYVNAKDYCIVECLDCGKPMIVLKRHGEMSKADEKYMQKIADNFVGGKAELYVGHGRISNDIHPHFHIRKKVKIADKDFEIKKETEKKEINDAYKTGL